MAHRHRSLQSSKPEEKGKMRWDYTLGCVGVGVAIVLVLLPPTSPVATVFWLVILFAVLVYPTLHLVRWAVPLSKKKTNGIAVGCLCLATVAFGFRIWPAPSGRHLTQEQREGFARVPDSVPKNCGMLVYVPIESAEAQGYGKEIQSALRTHGKNVNLIYAGAVEPPVGIVLGIRSVFDVCGQVGETLSTYMTHTLNIPTRLQENFLPYADATTIVIFVGTKPPYD